MSSHYLDIRMLHIACAYASISLFVVRHVLNLFGVGWRRSRALRIMPHIVDSLLLAAGITLMFITHQYPFVNGWLTMKLFALIAYIVLGIIALKPSDRPASRRGAFLAAAAIFFFIISVARTHSPLGIFSVL
jgi:uncharacterized membrane protein SirB2